MKGLKYKADRIFSQLRKVIFGFIGDIHFKQKNPAGSRFIKPWEQAQQSCFTAAAASLHNQEFTFGHGQWHFIQYANLPLSNGVGFCNLSGFNDIHRLAFS